MEYSRIDLLLVDVDQTLVKGTLAEGDIGQLNETVVQLVDDANARGATVVILSNHPSVDDLWDLIRCDPRLDKSVCGCLAVAQPKLLTARLLLARLQVPPRAAFLLDDDPANVNEFIHDGIGAMSDFQAASERILCQSIVDPAFRRKRNAMRRAMIELFVQSNGQMLPAATLAYLAERKFLIEVRLCGPGDFDRIAELFARTNQLHFNPAFFNTRIPQEIETRLRSAIAEGGVVFVACLNLGGIDLGIQAAALVTSGKIASEIVNATMSCSVLPFSVVEPIFIKRLVALHNKTPINVRITDTQYNSRVRGVLAACGADFSTGGCVFTAIPSLTHCEQQFLSDGSPEVLFQEDGVPPITTFYDTYVVNVLLDIRAGLLLELGVGYGEMLGETRNKELFELVQKNGTKIVSSDLEPVNDDVLKLDAQAMRSIPSASVDAVFSLELIEHVGRPADVLDEIVRVLKPGGYLFLSAPGVAYPFHPFSNDSYRYSGAFLCGIRGIGFRIVSMEEQKVGDAHVRTMLLAEKTTTPATWTAAEWFKAALKTPLLDGLVLLNPPSLSVSRFFGIAKSWAKRWARSDLIKALMFLLPIVTLGITIERIYNFNMTQLLTTGIRLVTTKDEFNRQGLELLSQVQRSGIDYYDNIASSTILANLCNSRVSNIEIDGAKLFVPIKRFGEQWTNSVIENVTFSKCVFSNLGLRNVEFVQTTNLQNCKLSDLTGNRVILRGKLYNTDLVRSSFTDLDAYGLIVEKGELSDVEIHCAPGAFNTALFREMKFNNVTFSGCDFQAATFDNCEFNTVRFLCCNLSDAIINRCNGQGVEADKDTDERTTGNSFARLIRINQGNFNIHRGE